MFFNHRLNFEKVYEQLVKTSPRESGRLQVSLSVQYQLPYSLSREGLNVYIDEGCGEKFIYSQLIFHCWAVFPCFDQPDLKAEFSLKVITMDNWVAVSNAPEEKLFTFNPAKFDVCTAAKTDFPDKEVNEFVKENDMAWMVTHFIE